MSRKEILTDSNYFKHYSLSVTNKKQIPVFKDFKIFKSKGT